MWYIFDIEQEARDYDIAVTNVLPLPDGDNYANPRKHPTLNKWAILASPLIILEGKQPVNLGDDWTTNIDDV